MWWKTVPLEKLKCIQTTFRTFLQDRCCSNLLILSSLYSASLYICADASDFALTMPTLILNDTERRVCTQVTIRDDEVFEDLLEMLVVRVSNFFLSDEDLIGLASVNSTNVTIRDDDRFVVVGFTEDSLSVSIGESEGSAVLCVEVLVPEPDTEFTSGIEVVVGTRAGTAG